MKIDDTTTRIVKVYIGNEEIKTSMVNYIEKQTGFRFTVFDDFRFEFIKEGSPEYNTNKIRCTVTKIEDRTKDYDDKFAQEM